MMVARRTPRAGVRKPPREETAGGVERPRVRRYGDFGVGGVWSRFADRRFWDAIARGTKPVDRLRWAKPASHGGERTIRWLSNAARGRAWSLLVESAGSRGTVARRGAALERLDDGHATAAARTRVRERFWFVDLGAAVIRGLGLWRRHVEQAARPGDVVDARTPGEQAVVADAVEAVRQDVDPELVAGGLC
jgi:hypothetical protein